MVKDLLVVNRLLSITTSIALLLAGLRGIFVFTHLNEIDICCIFDFAASILYLLAAVLLLLDHFDVKTEFIDKRVWMLFFLVGFAVKIFI